MKGIIEYVVGRIEGELKQQKITKKRFAEMLGKQEAWLHSVFAFRRQLKAADFLKMLAVLKLPCETVLPPDLAAEIGSIGLDEYFSRLIGREIETYLSKHKAGTSARGLSESAFRNDRRAGRNRAR